MKKNKLAQIKLDIETAIYYLENLPSGIDKMADVRNPSPADAAAFQGGLAWQFLKKALRKLKTK